ncbi:MAG: S-layer homology domain-containing protein, partial [Peptococcaceae bacterium]|nr:S-layer homology domain-containing protein [Peptococcaceae bacterium]
SDGKAFLSAANDKIKETLEMSAHIKYIGGYPDETVRPDGEITRAEVAVIFWRLLRIPAKYAFVDHTFGDVAEDEWYAQAVKYLAKMGILKGYGDGTYKPSQTITRAEFAAIASRFDDPVTDVDNPFIDLPADHWAYADITTAYIKGWISGYPGGAFKPQDNITRGEVVAIINRVLGRAIAKDDVSANFRTLYSDLPITHWAFAAVIEASVSHEYERKEDGYEIWIAISRN